MKEFPPAPNYPVLFIIKIVLIIASIILVIASIAIPSIIIFAQASLDMSLESNPFQPFSIVIAIGSFIALIVPAIVFYTTSELISVIIDLRNEQHYANYALYTIVNRLYAKK
jgi:hypothetical protein